MIGGRVGGWPHGLTACLCEQQSSVHPCGSPPFPLVDGVAPTSFTSDCHLWMFYTSPS